MKKRMIYTSIVVAVFCTLLPSCSLIKSAASIPGSAIKMVGRTVGLPVSHADPPALKPGFEVTEGVIDQLD